MDNTNCTSCEHKDNKVNNILTQDQGDFLQIAELTPQDMTYCLILSITAQGVQFINRAAR